MILLAAVLSIWALLLWAFARFLDKKERRPHVVSYAKICVSFGYSGEARKMLSNGLKKTPSDKRLFAALRELERCGTVERVGPAIALRRLPVAK
ncbi:MAG: hypothetical protein K0S28_2048 [Paucimonas sp.]|nr:hypothetical protein [Paucimonas sp.]